MKFSCFSIFECWVEDHDIVAKFSESGFSAERFDRVEDFTKQISIVPCSAKTGQGIPELLMVMTGLAQKFLEESLKIEIHGAAKGTVLEVKEERGVGKVLDVVLYDGSLKQGDTIGIGTLGKPIFTKVRGIFEEAGGKLKPQKEVSAACGAIITAPGLEHALAGMPLIVVKNNEEEVERLLKEEVEDVLIETDHKGIIVKADTLGALEALIRLLKDKNIPIKKADIGEITKSTLADARNEKEKLYRVIVGFNVKSVHADDVHIITSNVIYKIIEDYEKWVEHSKRDEEEKQLSLLMYPAKVHVLRGTVFRQSHPAIFGVRVLAGKLRNGCILMREDGTKVGEVKSMQEEGENVSEAGKDREVAISLPNVTVGRQVDEDYILYSDIPDGDFVKLKKLKSFLKRDEIELLKEIAVIKRNNNPLWGV